jgi:hypothetical protein
VASVLYLFNQGDILATASDPPPHRRDGTGTRS